MIDISQATSLLQSLGVKGPTASRAVEQAAASGTDAVNFLKQLQSSLEQLSSPHSGRGTASASAEPQARSTASVFQSAEQAFAAEKCPSADTLPFRNLDEFRTWEKGLSCKFAPDYKAPDYIKMMGLSIQGGDQDAVKRYAIFKNNPQFAADYEAIHSGALSKFPTDGSTLIRSDLSAMPEETAAFYRKNPAALRLAEGLNMDPTLYKMRLDGQLELPPGTNSSEWLMANKWTAKGTVANENRLFFAQAEYIGLNGKGAGTYRQGQYDPATGRIIGMEEIYAPTEGKSSA
jgi:hypothetical protein